MGRSLTAAVVAGALVGAMAETPAQTTVPAGLWLTQGGDAKVRISTCGGGGVCGFIAWLKNPKDPQTGKPVADSNNPDPAKRTRPLMGVQLLLGLRPDGPNRWSGQIYNADDGQVYRGNITVLGPASLKIEGCVLAICGSETWTRTK